jgi:hypothetical protein
MADASVCNVTGLQGQAAQEECFVFGLLDPESEGTMIL